MRHVSTLRELGLDNYTERRKLQEEHCKGYRVPQGKRIEISKNVLIREEPESKNILYDNDAHCEVAAISEICSKEDESTFSDELKVEENHSKKNYA